MNYLILNGSPHRENTWKLVALAKETVKREDPYAQFDEIHLADIPLPFCLGCSACFRLGHEKCPHSAAVAQIIRSVDRADGVIVASTVYNRRETALLKNVFDHLSFLLHRPRFFKAKALVVTTAGAVGAKQAAKSIAEFLTGTGFNRCYLFSAASLSWNDYRADEKTKARLERVSKKFAHDVLSGRLHSPSCLSLLSYNLFRGMSLSYGKGSEYETRDGAHWHDASRRSGVFDRSVAVPFYKKPVGQLFYLAGRFAGQKFIVTYKK